MASDVFLDTSFILAIENRDDPLHERAKQLDHTLMKQEGLHDALTADIHFRQAGFNALLLD